MKNDLVELKKEIEEIYEIMQLQKMQVQIITLVNTVAIQSRGQQTTTIGQI